MIPHGTSTHGLIRTTRLASEPYRAIHAAWSACRTQRLMRTTRSAFEPYHSIHAAWLACHTHRPIHTRSTLCAR